MAKNRSEFREYLEDSKFFIPSDKAIKGIQKAVDYHSNQRYAEKIKIQNGSESKFSIRDIPSVFFVVIIFGPVLIWKIVSILFKSLSKKYREEQHVTRLYEWSGNIYSKLGSEARRLKHLGKDHILLPDFIETEIARAYKILPSDCYLVAQEFTDWLKSQGKVKTGWGSMEYVGDGKCRLMLDPED